MAESLTARMGESNVAAMPGTAPLSGDRRQWLSDLYEANSAAVLRVCLRVLRDREEAADACHEVFLRAANAFDGDERMARAWLLTVARNHCLDLLRRRERFGKALARMGQTLNAPPDPEAAVVSRQTVGSVFRHLPRREQTALWQSAIERRTVADIADGLRLSYMAAAQVLSRARRHAAIAAARVAAIAGVASFYRFVKRAGAIPHLALVRPLQLAAIVAVPLVAVSIQSSRAMPSAHSPASSTLARHADAAPVAGHIPGSRESTIVTVRVPHASDTLRATVDGAIGPLRSALPSPVPSIGVGRLNLPTPLPSLAPSPPGP
jgi:RNA polymerase sigma-70 factor, ECF subfamily